MDRRKSGHQPQELVEVMHEGAWREAELLIFRDLSRVAYVRFSPEPGMATRQWFDLSNVRFPHVAEGPTEPA